MDAPCAALADACFGRDRLLPPHGSASYRVAGAQPLGIRLCVVAHDRREGPEGVGSMKNVSSDGDIPSSHRVYDYFISRCLLGTLFSQPNLSTLLPVCLLLRHASDQPVVWPADQSMMRLGRIGRRTRNRLSWSGSTLQYLASTIVQHDRSWTLHQCVMSVNIGRSKVLSSTRESRQLGTGTVHSLKLS